MGDPGLLFCPEISVTEILVCICCFPGGWGTMDELFETLTLVQTGMIHNFPVVLMGKEYYQPLMDYLDLMLRWGTISKEDMNYIALTDEPAEAIRHIEKYIRDNYKIKRRKGFWLLGEKRPRK